MGFYGVPSVIDVRAGSLPLTPYSRRLCPLLPHEAAHHMIVSHVSYVKLAGVQYIPGTEVLPKNSTILMLL